MSTDVPIPLSGGAGALAGSLHRAAAPRGRALVLAGALAAPARYLRHTADRLAEQGWDVLRFDYRGIGASQALGRPTTNLDDWGEDLRAAVRATRQELAPQRLLLLGHSLGGMLLGHAGLGQRVDGAVLVGSTHGVPSHYRGRGRLRIEAAYRVLPAIARACGGLPAHPWLLGPGVPRDVILHWVRWGRGRRFVSWDGQGSEAGFRSFEGPLLGVAVADDSYAPVVPVDALLDWFAQAGRRRVVFRPRGRLGHFGLFARDTDPHAQAALAGWLEETASACR